MQSQPPATERPYLSSLVKTQSSFKANEVHVTFGTQWRELVLPIRAFRVMVSNGMVSSIKNIVDDDMARLDMMDQFTARGRTSIFQLVEGEHMTKVDVRMGVDYVHAIRFVTSKRVSPWVGKAQGTTMREIAASDGFKIRSLFGSWGHGLRELGAVFAPLVQPTNQSEVIKRPLLVEIPLGVATDYRADFTVSALDAVGAVVVNADPNVKWIRVLSRHQVADLTVLQDGVYPGDNEHWLQLMDEEVVTGVEIVHDSASVKRIRWTTTLQTSPWMGQRPTPVLTRVVYLCGPHERICGFYGARGRDGITAFGVVVVADDSSQATERVVDIRQDDTDNTASMGSELWDLVLTDGQ